MVYAMVYGVTCHAVFHTYMMLHGVSYDMMACPLLMEYRTACRMAYAYRMTYHIVVHLYMVYDMACVSHVA